MLLVASCRPPSSSLPRRLTAAAASLLLLALAACGAGRVTDRGPGEQPAPAVAAPAEPGALPGALPGGLVIETAPLGAVPPVPMRVGLLLPLSGQNAALGQAMLRAAEMALFDVGGADFALLVRDTEAPGGPEQAAREVVESGARLVLGPVFGAAAVPAAGPAGAAGINLISFSTDRSIAGNGLFVMGVLPQIQVDRVVGYAASQGLRRFAALAPSSAFGTTMVSALNGAAGRFGGQVVQVQYYDPAAPDVSPAVQSLAAYAPPAPGGFEALLLPESGVRLQTVAPLLPFYDIDPAAVRLLGTALWEDPATGNEPALVGGWFAAPAPEPWQAFAARYEQLHGEPPPRLASLAYDGAALAAALARSGDFGLEALTRPSGFAGIDGIFRFRPDGAVERGLAVLEVQRGGARVVDPAPRSFDELLF